MYKGNLALQTGRELLSVGLDIEKNLHEVSLSPSVRPPHAALIVHKKHAALIDSMKLAAQSLIMRFLLYFSTIQVSLPFLVLHGTDDVVADPSGSKLLHERASSRDKTLKLYPGMWHVLMGERPEDVERVFADVISWLDDRVGATATVPGGTTNPL